MILEIFKNCITNKPKAVFGGGAFDFEYMNETLIVTTQRATKQFDDIKHLNICQGYVAAYEEWNDETKNETED